MEKDIKNNEDIQPSCCTKIENSIDLIDKRILGILTDKNPDELIKLYHIFVLSRWLDINFDQDINVEQIQLTTNYITKKIIWLHTNDFKLRDWEKLLIYDIDEIQWPHLSDVFRYVIKYDIKLQD